MIYIDFRPFQAWRYGKAQIRLNDVIAPPYDVISPSEQEILYARSPFNVVRLILGKEPNFYEHARQSWEEWTHKGILVQDSRPAFYLYEQVFNHPWDLRPLRRLALMGILNLDASGSVLPHEHTFSGPKRDRLLLLQKTQTNLSPVFGLYPNSTGLMPKLLSFYRDKPFLFQASDAQGVIHQGWAIEREEEQKAINEALASQKILIADGHHRFETAVEYRRQMREKFPNAPKEAPFDFVMMALVGFDDPGLLVLPTHRILHSLGRHSKKEFLEGLRNYFELLPCPEEKIGSELERRSRQEKVFGGIFGKEGSFLLRLKDQEAARKSLPSGKPKAWYELEANLLTHLVFDILWGVSGEERQGLIEYTRSWEEVTQAVREGRAEAGFLMRAPEVRTIRELADFGERMPQKTTYFYPKLASGLFFYHHG